MRNFRGTDFQNHQNQCLTTHCHLQIASFLVSTHNQESIRHKLLYVPLPNAFFERGICGICPGILTAHKFMRDCAFGKSNQALIVVCALAIGVQQT